MKINWMICNPLCYIDPAKDLVAIVTGLFPMFMLVAPYYYEIVGSNIFENEEVVLSDETKLMEQRQTFIWYYPSSNHLTDHYKLVHTMDIIL